MWTAAIVGGELKVLAQVVYHHGRYESVEVCGSCDGGCEKGAHPLERRAGYCNLTVSGCVPTKESYCPLQTQRKARTPMSVG
jgi:hypothetical protein